MRKIFLASLVLGATGVLQAATINLNTGQTANGGVIQTFSDKVWTINGAPAGSGINQTGAAFIEINSYPRGNATNNLWETAGLPPSSVANYISAGDCGRNNYTATCLPGTFSFTTQFIVNSGAGLSLNYQIAGDNAVALYLNGVLLLSRGDPTGSNGTGWATFNSLATATSGFNIGGVNTLELRVTNADIFTGGMLVGAVTGDVSPTPEPATYGLISGVLLGLGLLKRRTAY